MNKKIILKIFLIFLQNYIYGQQNLIKNPGFEEISIEPTCDITPITHIQHANFWSMHKGTVYLWGNNLRNYFNCNAGFPGNICNGTSGGLFAPVHDVLSNGGHYPTLSLDYGSVIQSTLHKEINKLSLINISMDIAVPNEFMPPINCPNNNYNSTYRDTKTSGNLFIHLLKNQLSTTYPSNAGGGNCNELKNKTLTQFRIPFNGQQIGYNQFTRVSTGWYPTLDNVKQVSFGGADVTKSLKKDNDNCFKNNNGHLSVDNFSLQSYSMCECTHANGTKPLIPYSAPNVFTPNQDGINDIWRFHVDNMIYYDIEVYDRHGKKLIFKQKDILAYEGNGSVPCVLWNGTDNNGNDLDSDVYFLIIKVKNCKYEYERRITVTKLGNLLSPYPNKYYFDPASWACCTPNYYLQNELFESGITYEAAQTITAINVTSNATTVIFQAGNEIVLGDNFVAENGKEFVAFIAECIPGAAINYGKNIFSNEVFIDQIDSESVNIEYNSYNGDNPEQTFKINPEKKLESLHQFHEFNVLISPNPFSDELDIKSNVLCKLKVYNLLGMKIYEAYLEEHLNILTYDWQKGIYIFELENNISEIMYQKVIKL